MPASGEVSVLVGIIVGVSEVVGGLGVPVADGGGVVALVPVGSEDTVTALLVAPGAEGGAYVPWRSSVGLAAELPVGDVSGAWVGVALGDAGLIAGCGRGACGLSSTLLWGSRRKPIPSPATARTEPTALWTARARRRARTPDCRRFWCLDSKRVCSWASRIIRANSRSK